MGNPTKSWQDETQTCVGSGSPGRSWLIKYLANDGSPNKLRWTRCLTNDRSLRKLEETRCLTVIKS